MKRIVLTLLLSVFTLGRQGMGKEENDWKSIHLFQGFHFFRNEELPELSAEEYRLVAALENVSSPSSHQVLLKEKTEYFAFNVCDLSLWKWNGDKWTQKIASEVSGYNCTPYFFIQGNQAYSISGSGYWQNQADLFKLNEIARTVEFIPTFDQPKNFRGHVYFQNQKGIYTLFGHQFDARLDVYESNPGGFFLDLSTHIWQKLTVEWSVPIESEFEFLDLNQVNDIFSQAETENYAILELHQREAKKSYWLIINKRDLSIYIKEIPFPQITDSKWIQVIGDRILHLARNSSKPSSISLDDVIKSSKLAGNVVFYTPNVIEKYLDDVYFIIVLLPLGLLILGGWWIGWKRNPINLTPASEFESDSDASDSHVFHWLNKLSPFSGKLIDQDQMDSIFDLSDIKNADLRKVKRSRAIKAINDFLTEQLCPEAILRVRDIQDKRVIRYKIQVAPFQKIKNQLVKNSLA